MLMETASRVISINFSDAEINRIANEDGRDGCASSGHFNQSEEFFLKLDTEFEIPQLPIHHDINHVAPKPEYLNAIRDVVRQLVKLVPHIFKDTSYYFEPTEILKPRFCKLYMFKDTPYLYLLKLNLLFRTHDDTIVEKGTNDRTPRYRTRHLFLEGLFIPLESAIEAPDTGSQFAIKQTISDTWIGETGRGYFAKGIWIDDDLTKFFAKLFIPKGKRLYPYYPFVCQYKTFCQALSRLSPADRLEQLPQLHKALDFVLPHMDAIQNDIKGSSFSEDLAIFNTLKSQVDPEWEAVFQNISIDRYLNENDMREFSIAY